MSDPTPAVDGPDVDPATGDERATTGPDGLPWLEPDDEFEGVGAHPSNPRYDHATALADHEAASAAS